MSGSEEFAEYLRRLGAGAAGEQFTAEDAAGLAAALGSAMRGRLEVPVNLPRRVPRPGAPPARKEPEAADVTGSLDQAAVALHEMFGALQRAGFSEDQALRYLASISQQRDGA
jgi:hypothetical protein